MTSGQSGNATKRTKHERAMNIKARNILVDLLRRPYAWPGGYERIMVLHDGACLCSTCYRKEARRIMGDVRDAYDTGWLPAGSMIEAVSPDCTPDDCRSSCGHCGRAIGECA